VLKLVPVLVVVLVLMWFVNSFQGCGGPGRGPGRGPGSEQQPGIPSPPAPPPQPPEVRPATVIRVTGSGYELNGTPITLPDLKQHLLADRDRLKQSAEPVRLTFNKKDVRMVPLKEVRDLVNELDLDPVEQEQ
jgi:hypothetical protein